MLGIAVAATRWAYRRPIEQMEVAEMLTGEMAKSQIQDRIRAAEHDRLAGSARGSRQGVRSPVVRQVGSGLLAAVVGRRRKATPAAAAIEVAR